MTPSDICNNCGASKRIDRYRACESCRAEWRQRARKPGGPADRIEKLEAALRLAIPVMRENLHLLIESTSVPEAEMDAEERLVPRPGTMDRHSVLIAAPVVRAIRAAVELVGRPSDGRPDWLDDVIAGRRKL